MVDGAIKLSESKFHQNNLNLGKDTLVKNGYPLKLLSIKINERCNFLIIQLNNNNTANTVINNEQDFFLNYNFTICTKI